MCSKLLPIILLEFPRIFTYIILLCLAYYSKIILRRYTYIKNTSFKIVGKLMKLNPWCWLQLNTVNKVWYDCTIGVSKRSIRVSIFHNYNNYFEVSSSVLFQPNNVSYNYLTGSAKRGLIAFLNFQLWLVKTHTVFSLICKIGHRNRTMLGVQGD